MKYLIIFTKVSFTGLLLLLFNSCILTVPKERRPCYKELKKFADENWKFSHNDSILVEDSTLLHSVIKKEGISDCAKGMNSKEIKSIFGKPHEVNKHKNGNEGRFYYYTNFCYPSVSKSKICSFYLFQFDEEGHCISFGAGGVQKSH